MEESRPSSLETSTLSNTSGTAATASVGFAIGSTVMYGLHGRCHITGIESRSVGAESQSFYKVEVQRSTLSRSKRPEPAIWVPVQSAESRGLRLPMNAELAERAMQILLSREYYFSAQEPWSQVFPKVETTLRTEGGIGLAKVFSYLYVLKNRHIVPPTEVVKYFDSFHRQLYKELGDALHLTPNEIEVKVAKGLRSKLLSDQ